MPAQIGHNSVASDQLRSIVERVERLEEEQKSLAEDKRDVYAEAKANGFDTKTIRKVVKLRKMDAEKRAEEEALLETYMHALGMLADTPLGVAATMRAFGKSVPLTDEEKATGQQAAFVDAGGHRVSFGVVHSPQVDLEEAIAKKKGETFERVAGAAPVDPQS